MIRRLAIIAGIALFIGVLMLAPTQSIEGDGSLWYRADTTYSPGPQGTFAFYLLLKETGLHVARMTTPGYAHVHPDATLWLLGSHTLGRRERHELVSFMRSGGTLVAQSRVLAALTDDAGLGEATVTERARVQRKSDTGLHMGDVNDCSTMELPVAPDTVLLHAQSGAPVVATWPVDAGRMVSLGAPELLHNGQLDAQDNGVLMAQLAHQLGPRHVFDEVRQGFGEGDLTDLIKRLPYRALIAQLAVLVCAALWCAYPRRWPVRTLPLARRRRLADHVDAVAQLWQRGANPALPLGALMTALNAAARARRVGQDDDEPPFVAWVGMRRPALHARASAAWARARDLCERKGVTDTQTFEAAVELMGYERETKGWSEKSSSKP